MGSLAARSPNRMPGPIADPGRIRFRALLELTLVILLADRLAALLVAGWSVPVGPAPAPQAAVAVTVSADWQPSALAFDPFHRAAAPVAAGEAPETALNLKLHGVRSATADGVGSAIIRTPDNRQAVFRVGEEIIAGVVLHDVRPDRVVIARDGVTETLFLDALRPDRTLGTASSGTTLAQTGSTDTPADLFTLFSQHMRPRLAGGGMDGVEIDPQAPAAMFAPFGLRPGDIVLEVNGTRLDTPNAFYGAADRLEDAAAARLTIRRDGREQALTVTPPSTGTD